MKSLVTVVAVIVFGLSNVSTSAQYFGVEADFGISNVFISNPRAVGFNPLLSAKIGGTVDFDIADNFYLHTGLGFSKKGAATLDDGNLNFFYIQVPIGARFSFVEIGAESSLYAEAGLYTGVLLSAKFNGFKQDVGNTTLDDWKPLDLGLYTGVGFAINDAIDVGFATEFGLLNIDPEQSVFSFKNAAFMLGANFRFGI
ncbi:MAG: porin family protein [Maribacter sp.]|uniref:porin family protein n=1 Tax=Maribacter sp. TaxID=1897614 RepID=UPI00329A286B